MQNPLYQRFREHIKNFEEHLDKSTSKSNAEPIHELRLSIKKIRALSLILKKLPIENPQVQQLLEQVKPIFKKAGNIREPQVFISLAKNLSKYPGQLFGYLKNQEVRAREKYKEQLENFDLTKWSQRTSSILSTIESLNINKVIECAMAIVDDKNSKIEKLVSKKNRKYHKIRKQLKVNQEILLLLREMKSSPDVSDERETVKDLASLLGEWHDFKELQDVIYNYAKNNGLSFNSKKLVENIRIKRGKLENQIDDILKREQTLSAI